MFQLPFRQAFELASSCTCSLRFDGVYNSTDMWEVAEATPIKFCVCGHIARHEFNVDVVIQCRHVM